MEKVKIKTEYITLGQFLKFVGIISNGFEAKLYLSENEVFVCDEKEQRRGKKLYPGHTIKIKDKEFEII